ncbi:MAG: HIT family protein [Roseburia sp.]|nr:HIT family protein [Roseburia sp.]
MDNCLICERIAQIKANKNPYFVRELHTGYVVIGDSQRIKGYSLFLCKRHAYELHELEPDFRDEFLHEMAVVSEAVYHACLPDKLNYSLLGVGRGMHMHWHIHPRREGDTPLPGPVWQLGKELTDKKYAPSGEELEELKAKLNGELDRLLGGE